LLLFYLTLLEVSVLLDHNTIISGEKAQSDSFEDLTVENGLSVDAVVVVVKESNPNQVIRAVYIRGHDSYILMDLGIDKAEVYFKYNPYTWCKLRG